MKKLIFLFSVLSFNFAIAGNPFEKELVTPQLQPQKSEVFSVPLLTKELNLQIDVQDKCPKYKKLRRTGLILLCVGAPLAATGIGLIAGGTAVGISGSFDAFPMIGAGYAVLIGGIGLTGAGTPLFIIGNVKTKKYCGGKSTSFQINQSQNGIGLAYNF